MCIEPENESTLLQQCIASGQVEACQIVQHAAHGDTTSSPSFDRMRNSGDPSLDPSMQNGGADEPNEIESVIACLEDDARKLESENPGCEMAANMLAAATMLDAFYDASFFAKEPSSAVGFLDDETIIAVGRQHFRVGADTKPETLKAFCNAVRHCARIADSNLVTIKVQAQRLIEAAKARNQVVSIELRPRLPLSMGNYDMVVDVHQAREIKPCQ